MRNFLNTLKNIWTIEDLRTRILNTLGLILVYRIGSFIILPGVDADLLEANTSDAEGLAGIINMFAGGAFSRASILALGIMPYISASIMMQVLGFAVPQIQKLQRDGESGRRKINQWTRFLTVALTLIQAPTYLSTQVPEIAILDNSFLGFILPSTVILVTGTLFVMWLGERITDKGIGNGISLLIMIGIIANLPSAFIKEFASKLDGAGGLVTFLIELVILLLIVVVTILLVQGTRRIPVQYAKKIVGNKQYGGVRQYIPLKVNAAGVMPIIFAQMVVLLPVQFLGFAGGDSMSGITGALANIDGFWYNALFAVMIILFTYFYTAISVNPNQMADDMKKNGGFIPGVKPGKKTAEFLDTILSRITLPGSIFLAFVAILPAFASILSVDRSFANFFGGTSLLIMVGVVLDTLQQIESHLLMRHYDGLMKTGKIKGRHSLNPA
ncbi:MAG: preprotein translocase subunit SecY [Flavobacteriales bacterium]|nr:preprotein translocase subunit SecY [Flavobacteriales bacterium]